MAVLAEGQSEQRSEGPGQVNAELARACGLIADCCHALRSPLASIIAYAELLQEGQGGPLTALQKEYVGGILEEGQELLSSINDILDLACLEAGRLEVHSQPLVLAEVIPPLLRRVAARARRKGIRLEAQTPETAPVWGDRVKVERVIFNLLDNALKFTPAGGTVSVTVREDAEAGEVVLGVHDTGPGIPPDQQEAVFERFYRAREAGEGAGTGLGLALARQMVAMMGGRLWVESEPGRGANFLVALPLLHGR